MKHALPILMLMIGLLVTGCEDTDIGLATQAGVDAVRAVTLDDDDVRRLAAALSAAYDQKHTLAPPDNFAINHSFISAFYGKYTLAMINGCSHHCS